MRFEVPQFIEIEDKIFGPFTWRQFVYLLGGGGALFMIYIYAPFIVFVIIGVPIGLLAGALAFYKVNNRPFSFALEAAFMYMVNSRLYLWKKSDKKPVPKDPDTPVSTYVPPSSSKLASMSRQLEINALQHKR